MAGKPRRFGWVTPWLARGAAPRKKHYPVLRALGVDTLVNLRRREGARSIERRAPHLLVVHIAVRKNRPPSIAQAVKFLRLCDDLRSKRILYVHGKRGKGRTSTFCALVRLAQGWDVERAINEQRAFGLRKRDHRRHMKFLRSFAEAVRQGEIGIPSLL
ncbi:MAG TPA: hypothetical protein VFE17_06235 [Candidatus Baltobacteraceae bacterium]|nr:hypothetical protein [Candidatus Baltobacteraceae bacterium]